MKIIHLFPTSIHREQPTQLHRSVAAQPIHHSVQLSGVFDHCRCLVHHSLVLLVHRQAHIKYAEKSHSLQTFVYRLGIRNQFAEL